MFVDEVNIHVKAGKGGDGSLAFRRERYIPKGGPDGGDGGSGGSIYLVGDDSINTLHHLAGMHHWKAAKGQHGMGKKCHGKNAEDVEIPVPCGTLIYDVDKGVLLKDLATAGERVCVAIGGKGGKGNERFKTSVNQAPREFTTGEAGEERLLHLELKLIADVALVGMPNAGKSTLLSALSDAKPQIASYPFTTLTPKLGIVKLSGERRITMADLPGLIEGAHDGHGLGHEFLRHIERARIIVHLVDLCPMAGDPIHNYNSIRNELETYSPKLANTPEILVATKMDLTDATEHLATFEKEIGQDVMHISAITREGLDGFCEAMWAVLGQQKKDSAPAETLTEEKPRVLKPHEMFPDVESLTQQD
ncbi:MAG: GTPase ObgE [Phycisphaerales bacterium]|nr:GTPase ObgE [Phycisphaerales bacterium]MBT7171760.1 GTPase ObgE [Phycisphaerales bacterium]